MVPGLPDRFLEVAIPLSTVDCRGMPGFRFKWESGGLHLWPEET